jgi:hypothetical protein
MGNLIKTGTDLKKYNSAVQKDFQLDSIQSFIDDADNDLIIPAVGRPTLILVADSADDLNALQQTLYHLLAKSEVNYAIAHYTSSGSVNISDAGISVSKSDRTLPASDKKLVALRTDSLEKAYNSLALAIEFLEENKDVFTDYAASAERINNRSLFILTAKEFQESGVMINNSSHLFDSLKTYIRNAEFKIEKLLGGDLTNSVRSAILANNADEKTGALIKKIRRPVAFAAMAEAVLFKAVSVTPNGVFTTSHTDGGASANIENRATASEKFLNMMFCKLENSANAAFDQLKQFLIDNAEDYSYTIVEAIDMNDYPERNSYYL